MRETAFWEGTTGENVYTICLYVYLPNTLSTHCVPDTILAGWRYIGAKQTRLPVRLDLMFYPCMCSEHPEYFRKEETAQFPGRCIEK